MQTATQTLRSWDLRAASLLWRAEKPETLHQNVWWKGVKERLPSADAAHFGMRECVVLQQLHARFEDVRLLPFMGRLYVCLFGTRESITLLNSDLKRNWKSWGGRDLRIVNSKKGLSIHHLSNFCFTLRDGLHMLHY